MTDKTTAIRTERLRNRTGQVSTYGMERVKRAIVVPLASMIGSPAVEGVGRAPRSLWSE